MLKTEKSGKVRKLEVKKNEKRKGRGTENGEGVRKNERERKGNERKSAKIAPI